MRQGCADICGGRHAGPAVGAFCGAPYGATKRAKFVPAWSRGRRADLALGAVGGAPERATERVGGAPTLAWGRCVGLASEVFGRAPHGPAKHARGVPKWAWSPFGPCWRGFLWVYVFLATKRLRGVPQGGTRRRADLAAEAFGGAPYGATSVRRMRRNCQEDAMRALPLRLPLDLLQGPRNL